MVTLSSCLIPPNEYGCLYALTTLENFTTDRLTEDADFDKKKKSSFQMKLILFLAGMQTSKIVAFGAQNIH